MTHSPFKIYSASAGSGKTHTLTKEYLKIILSSPKSLGTILALTFTNKAVGEMKHRILDSLFEFGRITGTVTENDLFLDVKHELRYDTETLRKKAKNTLKEILHNYAFFDISTIDKFTHRLIRTFAKDLNLPQNFEVVLDRDLLLNEAVSRLIFKAGNDPLLTKVLIEFALEKIDEDKSWDVTIDLNRIGKLLFEENHKPHIDRFENKTIGDFSSLKKVLRSNIEVLKEKSIALARSVLVFIDEAGLEVTDFPRETLPNHFKKIVASEFSPEKLYKNKLEENLSTGKILKANTNISVADICPEILKNFLAIKENVYQMAFLKNAYQNIVPLTVLNAIQNELKQLQEERDQLSISEFNTIISREIKNQPAPFIYERLGEKYRHYFIDEFQDTSTMQWENLIPLIDNALVSEDNLGRTGSLFLVGDAKQAIYRWRGGRAEQFLDLITRRANPFPVAPKIYSLPTNYRSDEEIIKFNNDFFQTTGPFLNNPLYQQLFIDGNKQKSNAKKGGYVQLTFVDGEEDGEKDILYGQVVENIIRKVLDKGHSYGDICILARSNKEGVAMADFLTQQNVPVVSSESLLLSSSEKVRFLVNLLRYQIQPEDLAIRYSILSYLSQGTSQHRFIVGNIGDLGSLLQDHYNFDTNLLKKMSVYDGLELAIKQFDLADNNDAYIIFLMDTVLEIENKEGTGAQLFLDYWDKKKGTLGLSAPTSLDAVKIMTVHKAKGLEFPIVIFPYANEHIYKRMDKKMWLPVNQEDYKGFEELLINEKKEVAQYGALAEQSYVEEEDKMELDAFNMLYVALTRAEKALYIVSKKHLDKNGLHNTDYYSGLFIHYLKQKGIWEDDRNVYHFGEMGTAEIAKSELQGSIPYQYTYKERPGFRILTASDNLWDTKREAALTKGNIVHHAMSLVETGADVDHALMTLTRKGDIQQDELELIRATMNQIIGHPKLSPYFREGQLIKNEKDIITENGQILRPDRLVINGKKATIIDYKTGKKSLTYHQQLYAYGDALEQMGLVVENKIIVYIDQNIVPEFI